MKASGFIAWGQAGLSDIPPSHLPNEVPALAVGRKQDLAQISAYLTWNGIYR